jgi:hypothetical protein
MKKKQKTFAERAKEIQSKYSRAEWDKLERKDMMKELAELRDEQESVRASMGIGNDQGQQFDGFNNSQYLPKQFNIASSNNASPNTVLDLQSMPVTTGGIKADNSLNGTQAPVDIDVNKWNPLENSNIKRENLFQSPSVSPIPALVSAGMSAIGDIAGLINQKKNTPIPIQFPRVASQNVSYEPQRQALQRSYNTASNVMLKNSRDVGSPANAYANQIAGISGLTDSMGTQMGQSYMTEANTNAQNRMSVSEKNANIGMQEQMENAKYMDSYNQTTAGYINSLSQTVPLALRDYRQQVDQNNMLSIMGKDYGLYSKYRPNMNSWQKFVAGLQGPQFSVLNRNNPNVI